MAYDFTMERCRTEEFGQIHMLSGLPNSPSTTDDVVVVTVTTKNGARQLLDDAVRSIPVTVDCIHEAPTADSQIRVRQLRRILSTVSNTTSPITALPPAI